MFYFIDLTHVSVELACDANPDPTAACSASSFDILVFEAPSTKSWIDHWPSMNLCCTQEMADTGRLILKSFSFIYHFMSVVAFLTCTFVSQVFKKRDQ